MHSYSTFSGSKHNISTFNMFIIIHETVDIIAEMKQSGVLIFLMKNSLRNQLRHCNVPPNHRPMFSSISYHHHHPCAGNDFHNELWNNRLTHTAIPYTHSQSNTPLGFTDYQGNNPITWGPSTYSSKPTITSKHIQPSNRWVPWTYLAKSTQGCTSQQNTSSNLQRNIWQPQT